MANHDDSGGTLEPQFKSVGWGQFMPEGWFNELATSSLWLSSFRVARVSGRSELTSGPRTVDLGDVTGVVFHGHFEYLDPGVFTLEIPESPDPHPLQFRNEGMGRREAPTGVWLALLTPYEVDGRPGDEVAVRRRIEAAAGLMALFEGYNIVFEPGPSNIISLATGQPTVASPALVQPYAFPKPDVSESELSYISRAASIINTLQEPTRNRLHLALHWLHLALRDWRLDSFIKRWIALEVLAMPDSANIRPINECLAAAYGMTYEEARETFRIGRLADMRARVVHGGQPLAIHQALDLYMAALFLDLLLQLIGEPCLRRAASMLAQAGPQFWDIVLPPPDQRLV